MESPGESALISSATVTGRSIVEADEAFCALDIHKSLSLMQELDEE